MPVTHPARRLLDVIVADAEPPLTPEQADTLARVASALERYYDPHADRQVEEALYAALDVLVGRTNPQAIEANVYVMDLLLSRARARHNGAQALAAVQAGFDWKDR